MEKYYCKCCNYITIKSCHMDRHIKTKKHSDNEKSCNFINTTKKTKVYQCSICNADFADRKAKWRHEQKCKQKLNLVKSIESEDKPIKVTKPKVTKNKIIDETVPKNCQELAIDLGEVDRRVLAMMYTNSQEQLKKYESIIENLASSNKVASEANKSASEANKSASEATIKTANVASKSMSILKYASIHMADAPPLTELNKEEAISILNYKGNDKKLNKAQQEDENELYVKTVIAHYINKNLINILSDMVVAHFRKPEDDVKKMSSIWAVDVARLSFIIMHSINKNGEKEWKDDKTGKSFKALVIRPMLEELTEILKQFIEYKEDWLERNKGATVEEMGKIMNLRQKSAELMKDISYRQLEQPIIKNVAPSFQFDDYLKKK